MKLKMNNDFDSRHRTQSLAPLHFGYTVWLPDEGIEASAQEKICDRATM